MLNLTVSVKYQQWTNMADNQERNQNPKTHQILTILVRFTHPLQLQHIHRVWLQANNIILGEAKHFIII